VDGSGDDLTFEFETSGGHRYQFAKRSVVSRFSDSTITRPRNGRRRWMLTRYEDGHASDRDGKPRGQVDPRDKDGGWTILDYFPDSDRVMSARRTNSPLKIEFGYEDMSTYGTVDARIHLLVLRENFAFLKSVTLRDESGLLYEVAYTHLPNGNLTEARRPDPAPAQIWRYGYVIPPAAPLSATDCLVAN